MKALIVAESLQPVVRLCDMAERYDILPHHLSDWRRYAFQSWFALPSYLMRQAEQIPSLGLDGTRVCAVVYVVRVCGSASASDVLLHPKNTTVRVAFQAG